MYHYLYQQLLSFKGLLLIGHGLIVFHSLKWGGIFHEPKCLWFYDDVFLFFFFNI